MIITITNTIPIIAQQPRAPAEYFMKGNPSCREIPFARTGRRARGHYYYH